MPTPEPARTPIATRRFDIEDQRRFAGLTGDRNPMHLDAVAARRTQAGEPVVHGVHGLLWALDRAAAAGLELRGLRRIDAKFSRFMALGREFELRLVAASASAAKLSVCEDGVVLMSATLAFGERAAAPSWAGPDGAAAVAAPEPIALKIGQMAGRSGRLLSPSPEQAFAAEFPHAAEAIGAGRLAALGQTSTLVGMVCPGLHSIFSGLALDLVDDVDAPPGLAFEATSADARFSLVDLRVRGGGLAGEVLAFARPEPVEAAATRELRALVAPGEFAGGVALVVGGSRGLGALTAKLLAAGGARVVVTYLRGRDDAQRLCDEINAEMGAEVCTAFRFDAMQPVEPQVAHLGRGVSHAFYFATGTIFRQRAGVYSPGLFAEFVRVYVDAFQELCAGLSRHGLAVFYPSTVFVDERPKGMTEYAMAKAAGECLCADLARATPGLRILAERLPRTRTDQTATVAHADNADPLDVMLPVVRRMFETPR